MLMWAYDTHLDHIRPSDLTFPTLPLHVLSGTPSADEPMLDLFLGIKLLLQLEPGHVPLHEVQDLRYVLLAHFPKVRRGCRCREPEPPDHA